MAVGLQPGRARSPPAQAVGPAASDLAPFHLIDDRLVPKTSSRSSRIPLVLCRVVLQTSGMLRRLRLKSGPSWPHRVVPGPSQSHRPTWTSRSRHPACIMVCLVSCGPSPVKDVALNQHASHEEDEIFGRQDICVFVSIPICLSAAPPVARALAPILLSVRASDPALHAIGTSAWARVCWPWLDDVLHPDWHPYAWYLQSGHVRYPRRGDAMSRMFWKFTRSFFLKENEA